MKCSNVSCPQPAEHFVVLATGECRRFCPFHFCTFGLPYLELTKQQYEVRLSSASRVAELETQLDRLAAVQDRKAMEARKLGAYNVANACAQFAEWIRCGQAPMTIHGDGVVTAIKYADTQVESAQGMDRIIGSGDWEYFE